MSIQKVREIKSNKVFMRNCFRKVIVLLFCSLFLNGLLCFGIYTNMINRKLPDYYSTTGLTPPLKLKPLSEPNYTSKALLESAPEYDDNEAIMTYE